MQSSAESNLKKYNNLIDFHKFQIRNYYRQGSTKLYVDWIYKNIFS